MVFAGILVFGHDVFIHALIRSRGEREQEKRFFDAAPGARRQLVIAGAIAGVAGSVGYFTWAAFDQDFWAIVTLPFSFLASVFWVYWRMKAQLRKASSNHRRNPAIDGCDSSPR